MDPKVAAKSMGFEGNREIEDAIRDKKLRVGVADKQVSDKKGVYIEGGNLSLGTNKTIYPPAGKTQAELNSAATAIIKENDPANAPKESGMFASFTAAIANAPDKLTALAQGAQAKVGAKVEVAQTAVAKEITDFNKGRAELGDKSIDRAVLDGANGGTAGQRAASEYRQQKLGM